MYCEPCSTVQWLQRVSNSTTKQRSNLIQPPPPTPQPARPPFFLKKRHAMFVDATFSPPKVINCSRVSMSGGLTPAQVAEAFIGYYSRATLVPPSPSPSPSPLPPGPGCPGCQLWQWINSGQAPCPGSEPPQTVYEPERWVLGPPQPAAAARERGGGGGRGAKTWAASESLPLRTMLNDVYSNACGTPQEHIWASSDWQTGYKTPADPRLYVTLHMFSACACSCLCVGYTYTHTHTHVCIYIQRLPLPLPFSLYVCVRVYICVILFPFILAYSRMLRSFQFSFIADVRRATCLYVYAYGGVSQV